MQPSNDNVLPEATDELLEKYKLKFSVMTNPIAGGCLVSPDVRDHRGIVHYELDRSDVLAITSMVQLLLKKVADDKIKLNGTSVKFSKLMMRIGDLQTENDALRLENEALKAQLTDNAQLMAEHEEAFEMKLDHISLFVRVLMGVYPKIDIFYVRNLIKQLLDAQ